MSTCRLHHASISVQNLDWYQNFFETVFEMTIRKTAGTAPKRQIWFHEGIQLNECQEEKIGGSAVDHISLAVENITEIVDAALKNGCTANPKGAHWFTLPNGVNLELMQL